LSGPDLRQVDVIFTGIEVRVHLLNYSSFLREFCLWLYKRPEPLE
jgi:hypothetical protein